MLLFLGTIHWAVTVCVPSGPFLISGSLTFVGTWDMYPYFRDNETTRLDKEPCVTSKFDLFVRYVFPGTHFDWCVLKLVKPQWILMYGRYWLQQSHGGLLGFLFVFLCVE